MIFLHFKSYAFLLKKYIEQNISLALPINSTWQYPFGKIKCWPLFNSFPSNSHEPSITEHRRKGIVWFIFNLSLTSPYHTVKYLQLTSCLTSPIFLFKSNGGCLFSKGTVITSILCFICN